MKQCVVAICECKNNVYLHVLLMSCILISKSGNGTEIMVQLSVITKGQVCIKQPRRLRPQCGPISHPRKKNQN